MNDLATRTRCLSGLGDIAAEIQWSGRPGTGVRFERSDWLNIPLSFLWLAFAVFWEHAAISSDAPILFRLWGVPFVALGLFITVGRFFWDAYVREHTWYGLTADSAIIVRDGLGGKVANIYLPSVQSIALRPEPDGTGTIDFTDPKAEKSSFKLFQSSASDKPAAFVAIANAADVFERCKAAQKAR
ncbi:MAG: hypothetical protein HKL91_04605 [Candidatus Eremiobacteraeota bacterium]|nr:hypothetical protein [Candidatus Eremiobacteraeota bacterium]